MTIETSRKAFACVECDTEFSVKPEKCFDCGGTVFLEGTPSGRKAKAKAVRIASPGRYNIERQALVESIGAENVGLLDEITSFLLVERFGDFGMWDPEKEPAEKLLEAFDASDTKDMRLAEATASTCNVCGRLGLGIRPSDGKMVCPKCGAEAMAFVQDKAGFEIPGEEKPKTAKAAKVMREAAAVVRARETCQLCAAKIELNTGLCTDCWGRRNMRLYGQVTCPEEKLAEHTEAALKAFVSGNWD